MALIRPRLNDFFNLPFTQEEVDFAIPFLDEDLPLYVDPFLLWKSPSQQDNSLHTMLTSSFNHLGYDYINGNANAAISTLIKASECNEVGLGNSKSRKGLPIGEKVATDILNLFKFIPQISKAGFVHFEEIQLLVNNISKDRISDISCSLLKSFLIDFTLDKCDKLNIPMEKCEIEVYDYKKNKYVAEEVFLPYNPLLKAPILLTPKRWLRFIPWISYDDYFDTYFVNLEQISRQDERISVLDFNRNNYDILQVYIKNKELQQADCFNDPLFKPLATVSVKRKLSTVLTLPTGKDNNSDKKFEDNMCSLLSTLVYPQLDFADMQSRTINGVLIRDLIFYNNRSYDFLKDLYDLFDCKQIVIELKNVNKVDNDHVDQLNRYLKMDFGRFGILFTRNPPPKAVYKNTIDLWSGQRKCILIMHDVDLKLMSQLYESKQRFPIDVIKKKYIEFTRDCPG